MHRRQQRRLQDRRTERQQFRRGAPADAPPAIPYGASCACCGAARATDGDAGEAPAPAAWHAHIRVA